MAVGTIVRFDQLNGYGFIQPDDGGEDVFLHVRVVGEHLKDLLQPGSRIEYEAVQGDRGVKAVRANLLEGVAAEDEASIAARGAASEDAWTVASLRADVTERLITASPSLTGAQIAEVRDAIVELATEYGWVR